MVPPLWGTPQHPLKGAGKDSRVTRQPRSRDKPERTGRGVLRRGLCPGSAAAEGKQPRAVDGWKAGHSGTRAALRRKDTLPLAAT